MVLDMYGNSLINRVQENYFYLGWYIPVLPLFTLKLCSATLADTNIIFINIKGWRATLITNIHILNINRKTLILPTLGIFVQRTETLRFRVWRKSITGSTSQLHILVPSCTTCDYSKLQISARNRGLMIHLFNVIHQVKITEYTEFR